MWTAVGAAAACISALFAAYYTRLTFRLLRTQTEPNVVVYVRHDDSRTTLLQIVIENIGRGLATEIRFTPSRPIPARAWGVSVDAAKPADIMSEGPLIEGIPALGPGDSRRVTWGQYGGLMKAVGETPITLKYSYRYGRRMISGMAVLECHSFTVTDAVDSVDLRIINELKRIADGIEAVLAIQQRTSTRPS